RTSLLGPGSRDAAARHAVQDDAGGGRGRKGHGRCSPATAAPASPWDGSPHGGGDDGRGWGKGGADERPVAEAGQTRGDGLTSPAQHRAPLGVIPDEATRGSGTAGG